MNSDVLNSLVDITVKRDKKKKNQLCLFALVYDSMTAYLGLSLTPVSYHCHPA